MTCAVHGMQVTPEQSLALVEYIAHLSVQDWNGIALDLRKLGFIPAGLLACCFCMPRAVAAAAICQPGLSQKLSLARASRGAKPCVMKCSSSMCIWTCPLSLLDSASSLVLHRSHLRS